MGSGAARARNYSALLRQLSVAIQIPDLPQVRRTLEAMRPMEGSAGLRAAKDALNLLRSARLFNEMSLVGERFREDGQDDPEVRRQCAQGLIDGGLPALALPWLKEGITQLPPGNESDEARAELQGLIGRAYKQMFVNSKGSGKARQDYLFKAIEAYRLEYSQSGKVWHGINLLALLSRARHDKSPGSEDFKLEELATDVLRMAADLKDGWRYATEAEANLALNQRDQAYECLVFFVEDPHVDEFALASTLRQFQEIWQLSETTLPGKRLLPLLRAKLMAKNKGSASIPGTDLQDAITNSDVLKEEFRRDFTTFKRYRTGLERGLSVCKLEGPDAVGTGVVVNGKDLIQSRFDRYKRMLNDRFVLTCAHVLESAAPEDIKVRFEAHNFDCRIKSVVLISKFGQADAALVALDQPLPEAIKAVPIGSITKWPAKRKTPRRVFLLGHPLGGDLSYSFANNDLIFADRNELHYRAPAASGSSGCPVFDEDWNVVGLHQMSAAVPRVDAVGRQYSARRARNIHSIIMEMGYPDSGQPKKQRPKKKKK